MTQNDIDVVSQPPKHSDIHVEWHGNRFAKSFDPVAKTKQPSQLTDQLSGRYIRPRFERLRPGKAPDGPARVHTSAVLTSHTMCRARKKLRLIPSEEPRGDSTRLNGRSSDWKGKHRLNGRSSDWKGKHRLNGRSSDWKGKPGPTTPRGLFGVNGTAPDPPPERIGFGRCNRDRSGLPLRRLQRGQVLRDLENRGVTRSPRGQRLRPTLPRGFSRSGRVSLERSQQGIAARRQFIAGGVADRESEGLELSYVCLEPPLLDSDRVRQILSACARVRCEEFERAPCPRVAIRTKVHAL